MTSSRVHPQRAGRRWASRQRTLGTHLLQSCLAVTPPDPHVMAGLLAEVEPGRFVALARWHGVAGLILEPLRAAGGAPRALLDTLRDDFDRSVHEHLHCTFELARMAEIMEPTGVRWAVVKGPAAVELLYGGAGGRSYHDLDILVDPAGFRRVLAAFEEADLRRMDRNWAVLRRDLRGEVHYRGVSGREIDLHWNLVNMYRGRMRVGTGTVLERALSVDLGGCRPRAWTPRTR